MVKLKQWIAYKWLHDIFVNINIQLDIVGLSESLNGLYLSMYMNLRKLLISFSPRYVFDYNLSPLIDDLVVNLVVNLVIL